MLGRVVGAPLRGLLEYGKGEERGGGNALLPVREGLVAEKPFPLPVDRVADSEVGVHGRGGVVGVKARDVAFISPVAVSGAVYRFGQSDCRILLH